MIDAYQFFRVVRVVVVDISGLVDVKPGVDFDLQIFSVGVVENAARLVNFDGLTSPTRRQVCRWRITVRGLKRKLIRSDGL